jgi:hypothetical protein
VLIRASKNFGMQPQKKAEKKSKEIYGISIDISAVYRALIEKYKNTICSQ